MNQSALPPPKFIERLRRAVRKMNLRSRVEQWYPSLGAVVLLLIVLKSDLSPEEGTAVVDKVLPIAVSAAAILAGFQATAQSVMLALLDSPASRFLRKVNKFSLLVKYHWRAILSLLLFVAVSIGVLVERSLSPEGENLPPWMILVLTFLLGWASLASLRIMRLMVKILMLNEPGPKDGDSA